MKKLLVLLMICCMCTACGTKEENVVDVPVQAEETVTVTEEKTEEVKEEAEAKDEEVKEETPEEKEENAAVISP